MVAGRPCSIIRFSPLRNLGSQLPTVMRWYGSLIEESFLLLRRLLRVAHFLRGVERYLDPLLGRRPKVGGLDRHAGVLPVRIEPPVRPQHSVGHVVKFPLPLLFRRATPHVQELRLARDVEQ